MGWGGKESMITGAKDDLESMKDKVINISICVLPAQETNVEINDLQNAGSAYTSI